MELPRYNINCKWSTLVDFNNIPKPFVEMFIEINQDYFRKL